MKDKKLNIKESTKKEWWREGVNFECQGTGKCCVARDGYGFVYLTPKDARRMALELKIDLKKFKKDFCTLTDGWLHLNHPEKPCRFLKNKKCTVYEGRPTQCRTWPFWPENMNAKTWREDISKNCPGVGKGPLISAKEIEKSLKADPLR